MCYVLRSQSMFRKVLIPVVVLASFAASAPVRADTGHAHGPKHGGVAREVGKLTYELVAKPDSLTLHVSDHGKPVSTRGASAEATIYAGNEKTAVKLDPVGENTLVAKGGFKTGVGVRVAVTVTLEKRKETRLTFNLK